MTTTPRPPTTTDRTYAESYYNCDGECIQDSDGDGICNELEVAGCQDQYACNFDASATDNDGSCTYPETYFDCEGVCLNDFDGDGAMNWKSRGVTMKPRLRCQCHRQRRFLHLPRRILHQTEGCIHDTDNDQVCDELEVTGVAGHHCQQLQPTKPRSSSRLAGEECSYVLDAPWQTRATTAQKPRWRTMTCAFGQRPTTTAMANASRIPMATACVTSWKSQDAMTLQPATQMDATDNDGSCEYAETFFRLRWRLLERHRRRRRV